MSLKRYPAALRSFNLVLILGLALSLTACGGAVGEDVGGDFGPTDNGERTAVFSNNLNHWGWLTFEGGDYFIEPGEAISLNTTTGTKHVEFWVPDTDQFFARNVTVSFASSATYVAFP